MSGAHPPLHYKDVVRALKALGFAPQPQRATSHEHWTKDVLDSKGRRVGRLKVTVDKPKQPFHHDLISSMAKQADVPKKRFYELARG